MKPKPKSESPFTGRWRIVSMSAWDEDYIDEEEEGFFEFDEKGGGEFHFGYVHGHMDCRPTTVNQVLAGKSPYVPQCCHELSGPDRRRIGEKAADPLVGSDNLINDDSRTQLIRLGQTQIDGMFARQDEGPAIDDSEFLPLVEVVLTAFEKTQGDDTLAEELWEYAFAVYDRMCKQADPTSTAAENRKLMQRYLLGKRRVTRRRR